MRIVFRFALTVTQIWVRQIRNIPKENIILKMSCGYTGIIGMQKLPAVLRLLLRIFLLRIRNFFK